MPATTASSNAPFFIVLNAGSGHSETAERRSTIESVLRDAGRRFQLTVVDQPGTIDEIAAQMAQQAAVADGVLVAAGGRRYDQCGGAPVGHSWLRIRCPENRAGWYRRLRLVLQIDGKLQRLRTATFLLALIACKWNKSAFPP